MTFTIPTDPQWRTFLLEDLPKVRIEQENTGFLKISQLARDYRERKARSCKSGACRSVFRLFKTLKGDLDMRLTGQGTGRKLGKYPVAIDARNRQNPATFELEKCVVLLRRASIVTRRSLVVQFF